MIQKKCGLYLKHLLTLLLFSWSMQAAFTQYPVPDSILILAKGKPADERIVQYSRKIFDFAHNNPERAKVLTDSVFILLKSVTDPDAAVYALRSVGNYYLYRSKYDSALYYVKQAQQLNNKTNDTKRKAEVLIDFGNIYIAMGSADSALACYQDADSIAGLNNPVIRANALLNIGSIYQTYKLDHLKALNYLEEAFKWREYTADLNKIILYQKMSIAYRHTGNDSLALEMAQQSYNMAMSEGLMGNAAAAINSMAQVYLDQGKYPLALSAFEKARDIAVQMDLTQGIIFTNGNIAQIYFEMGKYQESLELNKKILKIASDNKFDFITQEIYKILIPLYKKIGDYKLALETSEKLMTLQDSLAGVDMEKKVTEMEARYQSRIKEETIANQQAQIKNNRIMIWTLITTVSIVLLLLTIITRLFILKNKSLKKLAAAHKELTHKNKRIVKLIPSQPDTATDESSDHLFEKIYHYLITNQNYLSENITLEQVAAQININREYIRNAIKKTEGCNFKTFINNHRIDFAKNLIMENLFGKCSIDEIAKKSGFSNRTSFYRTFHEVTGFTPVYYKSQLKKHAENNN